ncbi:hypothetical protein E3N88_20435 [Mikania micrantha]|uniref:Uncharacterized protein n=1 Tax=Mikania micrantha TaxID=192012 RepID=A0A5N6NH17_9ASTR|nr:hypothetical protein E3N88_20435 [Mikania micrantha]
MGQDYEIGLIGPEKWARRNLEETIVENLGSLEEGLKLSSPTPTLALIKERFQELERLLIHYLSTFEAS